MKVIKYSFLTPNLNKEPYTLFLQDKIGPANTYLHIKCEDAYHSWQQFSTLFLPPFTQKAWDSIETWTNETAIGLRFYIDGSSIYNSSLDARVGAAATVLIVDTLQGERFGGIQGERYSPEIEEGQTPKQHPPWHPTAAS